MTEKVKLQIAELWAAGLSYTEVAKKVGQSLSNIRAYCRRHNLGGKRGNNIVVPDLCEWCKKPVRQKKGRKHKRFCCDACRMNWWSKHRILVKQKTFRIFVCKFCGNSFKAYGLSARSYCSTACYHSSRRIPHPDTISSQKRLILLDFSSK